ncbi:MAG TPA: hypothetical protein PLM07_04030 [Candidatus Rifleibacterium sp.]|nr:hypothetical protein [Candidatus Rifleibacterium sp.]HPT45054.1 hypothetical protein [Candidatus Rifleibacterium sp.]
MTTTTMVKRELRDEMWRVSTSLRAVSDLMVPEADLSGVDRERLATLLDYLSEKLSDLMTQAKL